MMSTVRPRPAPRRLAAALCAVMFVGLFQASAGLEVAWAQGPAPKKEDNYKTSRGEFPPNLDEFITTLNKLKAEEESLVNKIDNAICIDDKKLKDFLQRLSSIEAAILVLNDDNALMVNAIDKNNRQYISDKQYSAYDRELMDIRRPLIRAKYTLKDRTCLEKEDSMVLPGVDPNGGPATATVVDQHSIDQHVQNFPVTPTINIPTIIQPNRRAYDPITGDDDKPDR